ncbi:hypothetical protein CN980_10975 [Bacillus cereus]|uniref:Carrier domain-containing protein n=1 Tax=Bacillus cereus TaxID=1396 RepID=A0A9X7GQF1_BACCE|nr:hypothetical protein CN980_10975 [Bacillus cereus]
MSNEEYYPLSHPQRRIWYTEFFYPDKDICNLKFLFKIHQKMDYSLLNRSVNRVISENDGLRIRLKEHSHQEPEQYFVKHQERKFDFFDFSSERDSNLLEKWIEQKVQGTFTLFDSDLYYFALIKLNTNECAIFGNVHHIIMDGLSIQIFANQIAKYYQDFHNDKEVNITINSYIKFLVDEQTYLTSIRFQKDQNYWLEEFKTLPSVTGLNSYNTYQISTKSSRETFILSESLKKKIKEFSEEYTKGIYTLFVATLSLSMYRWTSSFDIVLGMAYGNRMTKMERELIGMMVSTVPFRIDINPEEEVLSFINRVSRKQSKSLRHQKYPFDLLLKQINKESDRNVRLFGTTIDYRERGGSDSLWLPNREEVQDFAVHIENLIDTDSLQVHVDYREELFSKKEIILFFNTMLALMENIFKNPKQKIAEIEIISEEDKRKSLVEFNNPKLDFPPRTTIHELFEQQATIQPDAIAAMYEKEGLTYKEINERANQLAHYLQKKGVGPDSLVGLCIERSLEMIVGLLGILKAGGAYVPLDPTYPEQRLQYILVDSSIKLVVTQESLKGSKWLPDNIKSICLDRDHVEIEKESTAIPISHASPQHLAYVIYTSGSTGNPKGVMVEHHNVIRLFQSTEYWYQFDEKDTWTLFHSYAFDFSVWEIWGALLYGGKLVVVPYWISRSPKDFYQLLIEEKVTVLNQTPSAFRQLIQVCEQEDESKNLHLRYVIFGGEALDPTSLLPWFQRYGEQNTQLVNMYGITETTVHVTYYPITQDDVKYSSRRNIGKRIPDLEVYVLDNRQQPVPIGISGELYIGGAGLARGYLNRPELTAERFIPHPFSSDSRSRLYRTGDLARYLPDGSLDYLGRIDHQVKIRGFRIELGEIEAVLNKHESVKEAVVIVREDQPGDKRLVAYIVAAIGGDLDPTEIREYTKKSLPDYMIPSVFMMMSKLPLTPNGKINRIMLPEPEFTKPTTSREPRTLEEKILCDLFTEVLNSSQIGIDDDFFNLGGHSLLAVHLIRRIRAVLGVELSIGSIFAAPTVEELAKRLESKTSQSSVDIILPLRTSGEQLPIFCVHAAGGLSWCYAGLLKSLGKDYPIYGVQARGIAKKEKLPKSLDEMAADYLKHIREIQPHGPYKLLGWSLGGNVVHAMATHLQNQGEEVELLVMLDSYPGHLLPNVDTPTEEEALIALLALGGFNLDNMNGKPLNMENVIEVLRRDDSKLASLEEETILNLKEIHVNAVSLLGNYVPKKFHGNLVFFKATIIPEGFNPISPDIWRSYISGEIEQYDIDCTHENLCQSGPLTKIGQLLASRHGSGAKIVGFW